MIKKIFFLFLILTIVFSAQTSQSGSDLYKAGNAPRSGQQTNFDLIAPISWLFNFSVDFYQNGVRVQKVIPNKPFNVLANLTLKFWPTGDVISSTSSSFGSTGGTGPGLQNLTVNFIQQGSLPFDASNNCKTDFGNGVGYYYFNKTGSCAFSISNGRQVNVKYYNNDNNWKVSNGSAVMYCHGDISVNNYYQSISGESGNSFAKTFTISNNPNSINANANYFCVLLVDMNDTYFSFREGIRYFRQPTDAYSISLPVNVPYCKLINVQLSSNGIVYTGNPTKVTIKVTNNGEEKIKVISVVPNDNNFAFSLDNQVEIASGSSADVTGDLNYNGNQPMPASLTFNVTIQSLESGCSGYTITTQITVNILTPNLKSDISCPFNGNEIGQGRSYECNASIIFENFPPQGKANLSLKIKETTQTQSTIIEDKYELSPDNNIVKFNLICEDEFKIIEVNTSADPENSIAESNEDDNNKSRVFYCMGSLACSPQPVKVILLPGTLKYSYIFCGFDISQNRYLSCDNAPKYGVKDGSDLLAELSALISIVNDTTTSQPKQAYMLFNATASRDGFNNMREDEKKSYTINLTIENVQRNIGGATKELDYKCDINLTLLNSPCKYFI
ncbi:MAG: hypothetical protein QXP22_03000 [Candidatus Anstonellales archaeon]